MKPTLVILHCSDSPDTMDIGADVISEWHKQRGFKKIGYHYVIRRDGSVEKGREENEEGAHCFGKNKNSLGICLIGRNKFSEEQMNSLFSLYLSIKGRLKIDVKDWFGHKEFDAGKTCPNLDMKQLRERLASL